MADSLEGLASWIEPLIQKLDASQRTRLTRRIAHHLRGQNQQRIKQQITPDGQVFEPRKKQLAAQKGKIKRGTMFTKLRLARFMRTATTPQVAAIQLLGRTGRIAAVHHYGLRDTVGKIKYDYPARGLLGFSSADREHIVDLVLTHLTE